MTREQFLAGNLFRGIGDKYTSFKFVPGKEPDGEPGYVNQRFGSDALNPIADEYHANVKKVTKTRFMVYHAICGQTVRVWRNFADFEIIEK